MSESYWLLIDSEVALKDAPVLAARVVTLLLEREMLAPLSSLLQIGNRSRFDAGAKAQAACLIEEGDDPGFNEFEVWIGRHVHSSSLGDFAPKWAVCRHCDTAVEDAEAIASSCRAWKDGNDRALLACPDCGQSSPLKTWDFEASGGVGNLAFFFWSWPALRPDFIRDLEKVLGHPLVFVEGRC